MPNIMLYGFESNKARDIRDKVRKAMQSLDLGEEAVVSVIEAEVTGCNGKEVPRPYLRVCDSNKSEMRRIITALQKAGICFDTEMLLVDHFLSAHEMMMGRV